MSLFKRWRSGVVAQLDGVVARMENHEALAQSALSALQAATARAKARLERVRRDGTTLRARLQHEQQADIQWKTRALASGDDDKRALECLRRSRQAQERATQLEQRVAEHERVQAQLEREVRTLDERLDGLRQTHHVMRTRKARVEALEAAHMAGSDTDLDSIFERWEARLCETEQSESTLADEPDGFESGWNGEEERASLEAELQALRGGRHE